MTQDQAGEKHSTEEAWSEVGRQFEALGDSLSRAFRAAWESEETRRHVEAVQDGMEKMLSKVNRAVEEASQSPQGKKLRTEAAKTAETLRAAGEQTWQDAQPHLLSALTKINTELERILDRMERPETASQGPAAEDASGEETQEGTVDG
jgi:hypothetical protein